MGVSTNAYFYYGFDFYDSEDPAEGTDHLEEFLGEGEFCDDDGTYYDLLEDNEAYTNITIDYHCHSDFRVWFIAYKPFYFTALRGYPTDIDLQQLAAQDMTAIDAFLKKFCEEHEIPWQQPKWRLASYWG